MMMCPKCNKELNDDAKFCGSCGASVSGIFDKGQIVKRSLLKNNSSTKKMIMLGGIGIVVIMITMIFSFEVKNKDNEDSNYALYVKDSEIFISDLEKDSNTYQLTSRLVDEGSVNVEDSYILGLFTYISEDGKYIFFIDKVEENASGFNLY